MAEKHKKTLAAIFEKPDRADVDWDDFIGLVTSLGAEIKNSGGSAFGIKLNGIYAVFHRPHPGHTIYKSDLKRDRRFLENAKVI